MAKPVEPVSTLQLESPDGDLLLEKETGALLLNSLQKPPKGKWWKRLLDFVIN